MSASAPAIYAPQMPASKLSMSARLLALAIAIGCGAVLVVAYQIHPDATGTGTHTAIGLARCQFLYQANLPCPSCGMTTSFSHLAHGNVLAAVYVQPMGAALGFAAAATFWIGSYMAVTGKPALRLMRWLPGRYLVIGAMALAIAAWGWKIFLHLRGIDGWGA